MRNKIIGIILLLIGLSIITLGIIAQQQDLINLLYSQMAAVP
ncbi:MAG: hypothetical protein ACXADU_17595 [Promethearchaeota archaeon]|jgi:hypothetical protein